MKQYWFGVRCESQRTAGSSWKNASDGQLFDAGEIVEAEPRKRLTIRWQHQNKPELKAEGESLCTMEPESTGSGVKFSITHTIEREASKLIDAVSGGWPKINFQREVSTRDRLRRFRRSASGKRPLALERRNESDRIALL